MVDAKTKKKWQWPLGFTAPDLASYEGHPCLVVEAYREDVPYGYVPIVYLDRGEVVKMNAFVSVPADGLHRIIFE